MISFKRFIDNLSESPMLVHNVDWTEFTNKKKNQDFTARAKLYPGEYLFTYNQIKLYKVKIALGYLIYGIYQDKTVYAVIYSSFTNKGIVQTKVWRDKNQTNTKGLPSKIVFDILLRDNQIIFTDKEQSAEGKSFWINLIKYASNNRYDIGMVDFSNNKQSLNKWDNDKQSISQWLKENQSKIWGKSADFMNVFAFISRKGVIK